METFRVFPAVDSNYGGHDKSYIVDILRVAFDIRFYAVTCFLGVYIYLVPVSSVYLIQNQVSHHAVLWELAMTFHHIIRLDRIPDCSLIGPVVIFPDLSS